LFQHLDRLSPDAILGLMAQFRADPAPQKVDLGVGVFRDLNGSTPILSCVRRAEQTILKAQTTKSYVAAAGRAEFNDAVEELVLGASRSARGARRVRTAQTPGGCGALRVGAELIRAAAPQTTVHVSDPTWGNHIPLLGSSGLRLERYPYYDAKSRELRFDAMLEQLQRAAPGGVVLVHACCHNPTGADLSMPQWQRLTELLLQRQLTPFLDLAYQGFGSSLEDDVAGIRLIVDSVPEALIAVSYSKNLGLYRERVGALITVSESEPRDHGASIAACIFADETLRQSWIEELAAMRNRIADMRSLLASHLRALTKNDAFDFLERQRGMFSLLGVSGEAVEALRTRHHIYMLGDSRMNLAGITPANVVYVAEAIAAQR
jgi:aspartate aminotransferase